MKHKLIRITTVPISLEKLLEGQLNFMKPYYAVTAIASDKATLERVGILQQVPVFYVAMTRKITPFKDLQAVWQLYRYFKKEQPFIVHTHTPKAGTVGMLAAMLAGVPHRLHTVAGLPLLETSGNKRKLLNFVEKSTYACATMIYSNSLGLKNIILKEQFCHPTKLKVIGNGSSNGINTSYFNPILFSNDENQILRSHLGIDSNDFVFIFVGRLVGDKGINELGAAFNKVQRQEAKGKRQEARGKRQEANGKRQTAIDESQNGEGQNFYPELGRRVKLLLVGPFETALDPLHKDTLQEIEENPNIISVGYQNDVRPFFAISNALVFPSYREGFPNVVLQAGAMGIPSIVTNINGCNEIIEDQVNGLIIPVKDTVALEIAMKRLMNDAEGYRKMQQNARPLIVSRYEQQVVWDAILAEYRRLEAMEH
jgi:glycosyltransferase involved in cell wall biosynthesis